VSDQERPSTIVTCEGVAAQIGVNVVERRVPVSLKEGQELRLAFGHHGLNGLARAV
jgi:hypothetical protein